MQKLHKHYNTTETPQDQKIPGSAQVENSAGGYSFKVSKWIQLDRFLILGTEGGSYYATEKALTIKNADNVLACIQEDGPHVVRRIVEISDAGRAAKNDPALFALALCAKFGDETTAKAAYEALPQVARIGTHLFHFVAYRDGFGGWGPRLRKAIARWYTERPEDELAAQMVKYQSRDGWSHRDLLRLSHPKPRTVVQSALFNWATYVPWTEEAIERLSADKQAHLRARLDLRQKALKNLPELVHAVDEIKTIKTVRKAIALITKHQLPRECVPTEFLTKPEIWEALLPQMGLTALLRNLGNLSRSGLLTAGSDVAKAIVKRLGDEEALGKARIHPIQVLLTRKTYGAGHGLRGKGEWTPVKTVVSALDKAFDLAFATITPSGKRILIGLDVSGSMNSGTVAGVPDFSPREASCAMCLVTARKETDYEIMAFTSRFEPAKITAESTLGEAVDESNRLSNRMAGTDCALPMLWALENKIKTDAFLIYTDSETWFGKVHPMQALKQYRDKTGIPAKLVIVGMVGNEFSIADPKDAGMMDVVGFDANAPAIMADFIRN